jgi:hypothetical protein
MIGCFEGLPIHFGDEFGGIENLTDFVGGLSISNRVSFIIIQLKNYSFPDRGSHRK